MLKVNETTKNLINTIQTQCANKIRTLEDILKKNNVELKEVKIELGKVSWSSREDLTSSAIVVIASMFLLGIFIWICDFVFARMVNIIIKL